MPHHKLQAPGIAIAPQGQPPPHPPPLIRSGYVNVQYLQHDHKHWLSPDNHTLTTFWFLSYPCITHNSNSVHEDHA